MTAYQMGRLSHRLVSTELSQSLKHLRNRRFQILTEKHPTIYLRGCRSSDFFSSNKRQKALQNQVGYKVLWKMCYDVSNFRCSVASTNSRRFR